MKHYSPVTLERSTGRSPGPGVETEDALRADVRAQLGFGVAAKAILADRLGISEATLSKILRGAPIGESVAAKLGYRRVTRFERTS